MGRLELGDLGVIGIQLLLVYTTFLESTPSINFDPSIYAFFRFLYPWLFVIGIPLLVATFKPVREVQFAVALVWGTTAILINASKYCDFWNIQSNDLDICTHKCTNSMAAAIVWAGLAVPVIYWRSWNSHASPSNFNIIKLSMLTIQLLYLNENPMSPSRGSSEPTTVLSSSSEASTEARANIRSSSALHSAKQNIQFLFSPDSPSSPRPAQLRTRALLRSLRYIGIFIFWRIVRYAKYALVGSLVAALGATAFGGAVTGVGWILAPPTLVGSLGIGAIWAMGRWGFRKMRVGERVGEMQELEISESREGVKADGQWRDVQGPRAVPW